MGARRPSRLSLRRRLVVFSAPVMLVALLAAVKMISVVVAGNSAVTNFSDRDAEALGRDAATLNALNVVEPAKAPFAAGTLAVLQGRLDDADGTSPRRCRVPTSEESCPVLVNLELVRERRGDIDGWEGRPDQARERYRDAFAIVKDAPGGCFENNDDPDRNAVQSEATRPPDWRPNWPGSTTRRRHRRPRRRLHRPRRHPHRRRQQARPIPRDNRAS